MKNIKVLILVFATVLCASCGKTAKTTKSGLEFAKFRKTIDGKQNTLFTIENANGMEVSVTNYGARIISILVPDKNGTMQDVVLSFDNIDSFLNNKSDFGATIGRYGNRIAKGKFTLDNVGYQLTVNNNGNSLHGGTTGYQYQMFDIKKTDNKTLECTYLSPDGDNGYPGNLKVTVIYRLSENNALEIGYAAETDKPTVINLTNHSYFNISGNPENTILDHVLTLNVDRFTPTDSLLIPTGETVAVAGTPMDFTAPRVIGKDIDADYEPLKIALGYDHNWIFAASNTSETTAGTLYCPASGIEMTFTTDQPAVQFYTGNFLDGTLTGKKDIAYKKRSGLCLETQHYPDAPNHPDFPTTVLRPGEKYQSKTTYLFNVK
jgi:aldose 1-epimerase